MLLLLVPIHLEQNIKYCIGLIGPEPAADRNTKGLALAQMMMIGPKV